MNRYGNMLIHSTLTKSTKLSRYIESPLDNTVLVEDNLHELDGTCGWDPMRRGSLATYGECGSLCYSCCEVLPFVLFRMLASSCYLGGLECYLAPGVPKRRSHLFP